MENIENECILRAIKMRQPISIIYYLQNSPKFCNLKPVVYSCRIYFISISDSHEAQESQSVFRPFFGDFASPRGWLCISDRILLPQFSTCKMGITLFSPPNMRCSEEMCIQEYLHVSAMDLYKYRSVYLYRSILGGCR